MPWLCSSHGECVWVYGEDTSVPELQEFSKAMPWHVHVRVGACVHAMVLRRSLELLRWKLMAQRPWHDDDNEQRGSTGAHHGGGVVRVVV